MNQTRSGWMLPLIQQYTEACELEDLGEDGSAYLALKLTPAELTALYNEAQAKRLLKPEVIYDAMKIKQLNQV